MTIELCWNSTCLLSLPRYTPHATVVPKPRIKEDSEATMEASTLIHIIKSLDNLFQPNTKLFSACTMSRAPHLCLLSASAFKCTFKTQPTFIMICFISIHHEGQDDGVVSKLEIDIGAVLGDTVSFSSLLMTPPSWASSWTEMRQPTEMSSEHYQSGTMTGPSALTSVKLRRWSWTTGGCRRTMMLHYTSVGLLRKELGVSSS